MKKYISLQKAIILFILLFIIGIQNNILAQSSEFSIALQSSKVEVDRLTDISPVGNAEFIINDADLIRIEITTVVWKYGYEYNCS